jgi:hypothetical protein
MTRKQVDAHRRRSKSSGSGPWVTDYAAMAKKTVIKQVLKLCPASTDLVRALEIDTAHEMGERQRDMGEVVFGSEDDAIEVEVVAEEAPVSRTDAAKAALKAKAKKAAPAADAPPSPTDVLGDRLLALAGGNVANAEIMLSEATGGRLQTLAALHEAPASAHPVIASWLSSRESEVAGD